MADNRIARGIVLVPCLLLGGAFLATAAWGQGAAADNRTYTVALACSAVDASQEAEATAWLRQELPRRRKVNLRPVGSSEGQLMARVTPIGAERDLSTGLIAAGLASNSCGGDG